MMADDKGCQTAALFFTFCGDVFSLDTIKRAAYKFTDRFSFDFKVTGSQVTCTAVPLNPDELGDYSEAEAQFRNEVLDQDLRHRIAEETAPLRNVILAYAFSKTGLQER